MAIARDKFWLFGVRAHQDDVWMRRSREKFKRYHSRITPAEGAMLLDVPNVAMIICDGEPVSYSEDAYGYMESFRRMKKVLWGATGSGGFRIGNEEKFVVDLAAEYPNISGAYLDDFIGDFSPEQTLATLKAVREGLDRACRPMELNTTWYFQKQAPEGVLDYIDTLTIWTWHHEALVDLKENYERLEEQTPKHKKILGIYMYDFDAGVPIPDEYMAMQCEFGLDMLKQGRVDGLMFETNSTMGLGFESEKFLVDWIDKVKNTKVPD